MAHDHASGAHDHTAGANQRSLQIAFALTTTFLIVEVVGGIMTKSLALLSDAAHMFTDATALAIALMAIRIAKRPADTKRTFGYHRFEILAAAFNAMLLFGVAVYILYEAYLRLQAPPEIQSAGMLVVAIAGLIINLISMRILQSGQEKSLNVKGAYLEVWADMIGSVGVIAGAIILRYTGWTWVDSAVAVLIGLWVLPRTWVLLKSSVNILLEGVPEDVDMGKLEGILLGLPGVTGMHDLHVWAVTSGKATMTVHLVVDPSVRADEVVLPRLREAVAREFDIHHTTVQVETVPCHLAEDGDHFRELTYGKATPEHAHGDGHGHDDAGHKH